MRATYRTRRVLDVIAQHPRASNRLIAVKAGVRDQGQISRLLARLYRLQLIAAAPKASGGRASNAWLLTPKGDNVRRALKSSSLRSRCTVPPPATPGLPAREESYRHTRENSAPGGPRARPPRASGDDPAPNFEEAQTPRPVPRALPR